MTLAAALPGHITIVTIPTDCRVLRVDHLIPAGLPQIFRSIEGVSVAHFDLEDWDPISGLSSSGT